MWINAIKWLGLVLVSLAAIYGIYRLGYAAAAANGAAELAEYKRQTTELQFKAWSQMQHQLVEIDNDYTQQLKTASKNAKDTIDRYRNGELRLRKCTPTVSGTSDSTSVSDATATGGLRDRDVEDLIRLADRADKVALQLAACQRVLK